jgi:NADPH-dependent 2,4-dienoyl-CoA reductase/sulfur reductase-like enzyme
VVARAREHFAEADRIMKKCRRSTVRAPRIMGAPTGDSAQARAARLGRAARAREGLQAALCSDHSALRVHLMPRTIHVIGAGLAGLAAAVRLAERGERVDRARGRRAGGRALPLLSTIRSSAS